MKRRTRPDRATTALATLWLGLFAAGCAHHGPNIVRNNGRAEHSPNRPELSRTAPPPRAETRAPRRRDDAPAARRDYTPHQWPDPTRDLWSQVRQGLAFQPRSDRAVVRAWTQFYATHTHHLDACLTRARPFLWHVVRQVDQRGLPMELALLPIVESGYDPSATSYVGASGMWQFMPRTADAMSLSRDWWYDGRDDAIASTRAALNYLQSLHARYDDDWLLALAAYNAGPGRVDGAIDQARARGRPTDYWNLDLPRETENYIPKLLALRRIMLAPGRFGVDWPALANEPRTRAVRLPGQIELAVAASMLGMPVDELRRLNPGMRRWASAPHGHSKLLVPANKAAIFEKRLAEASPDQLVRHRTYRVRAGDALARIARAFGVSLNALRRSNAISGDIIRVGQTLRIPGPTGNERQTPVEDRGTHIVRSGDTLWDIAQRYGVSVARLKRANPRAAARLRPGLALTVPANAGLTAAPSIAVVAKGDTLWSIARAHDVSTASLRRWNRLSGNARLSPGQTLAVDGPAPLPNYYRVESGDSLWSIASRFSMPVTALRDLNDLAQDSTIRPGERLRLQPESISS